LGRSLTLLRLGACGFDLIDHIGAVGDIKTELNEISNYE
jgi:hypothetical protein